MLVTRGCPAALWVPSLVLLLLPPGAMGLALLVNNGWLRLWHNYYSAMLVTDASMFGVGHIHV